MLFRSFKHAGGFGDVTMHDRSPEGGAGDPLFAVWASKLPD